MPPPTHQSCGTCEKVAKLLAEDFERNRVELAVDVVLIPEAPGESLPFPSFSPGARTAKVHVDVVPSIAKLQLVVLHIFRRWGYAGRI